jgi:hypothetical protein
VDAVFEAECSIPIPQLRTKTCSPVNGRALASDSSWAILTAVLRGTGGEK